MNHERLDRTGEVGIMRLNIPYSSGILYYSGIAEDLSKMSLKTIQPFTILPLALSDMLILIIINGTLTSRPEIVRKGGLSGGGSALQLMEIQSLPPHSL